MKRFGQQMIRLLRAVKSAALIVSLCLLAVYYIGTGARAIRNYSSAPSADPLITANGAGSTATTLAGACDGLASEAVLNDRRQLKLIGVALCRVRPATAPVLRFHGSSCSAFLRAKTVYCDFFLLRGILHPQLALIAHASTVLC